jgi:molybdate/tungstate transport system ATP-binding protein
MLRVSDLHLGIGEFELQNVCLHLADEEYFVLMGPTGSGKSLLVKCICGLIRPDAGRVLLGGKDITRLPPDCREIGYVPQDGALFPHMDVGRNLTFGLRARGQSHRKSLAQAGDLVEALALGPLLPRRPETLSGGERQKVAVARALAVRPKLLVLDEPVSSLDESTREEVCGQIRRVQRELRIATVHVCHAGTEAAMVADRVGVLMDGRLVRTGTVDEVIESPAGPAADDRRSVSGSNEPPAR